VRRWLLLVLLASVVAGAGATLQFWPIHPEKPLALNPKGDPDRGAYLARMAGCVGCHTDIESDGEPLAGGPPLESPFGTFYAPNITPDSEFGVGRWTFPMFHAAVHSGVSPNGEPYYPAFPFAFYARLSEQDLADIWAALWTVPPVNRPGREHEIPFPFSQRAGLKLWRTLYFESQEFKALPKKGTEWNRGRFIVEGPAHCGACHTPRNLLGARDPSRRFEGAKDLPGGHESPGITGALLRADGWTKTDLIFALRMGLKPDGDSLGGSMGEVVRDSTSWLSEEDLVAIATYLLDDSQGSLD